MIKNDRDCLKLIDRYVRDHGDQSTNYKIIWDKLINDQKIVNFISSHIDHHQSTKYELLLGLLARVYVKNFDNFKPEIINEISNDFFKTENKKLVLSVHGDFTPFSKLMLQNQQKLAILSSYKIAITDLSSNTGIDGSSISLIPRDTNCFLVINQFLETNYVVSCAVDFRKSLKGTFIFISESLFRFARIINAPVYFSVYHVDNSGTLHYVLDGPHFDQESHLVNKFLKFIKKYKPHTHYEIAKFDYLEQSNMITTSFIKRAFGFLSRKFFNY